MHGGTTTTCTDDAGNLERIILHSLWPGSSHPVRLYGRFLRGELVYCGARDIGVSWTRGAGQDAESFEYMISNAILRHRGLPELDMVERRGGCREAARHLASYRRTAHH